MKVNGRLFTCDRCGETAFSKHTGDGSLDGGFTRWNKFEQLDGWSHELDIGDLCPECTAKWKRIKEDFARIEEEFVQTSKEEQ